MAATEQAWHERTLRYLGLGEQEDNADNNRAAFVRAACGRELPPNPSFEQRKVFEEVNSQLREIGKKLDPQNRVQYEMKERFNYRECLCGKLATLVVKNPEAAARELTEEQRRLAATVLGLAVQYQVGDEEEAAGDDGETVCTTKAELSRLARLAQYALYGTAYTAGAIVAPVPVMAVTVPLLAAALVSRWGQPAVRGVFSYLTDKYHVGAMRRALSNYTVDAIGREKTDYLRDYFVRYATTDSSTLSAYLINRYPNDATLSTLNTLLLSEVRERLREGTARGVRLNINDVVGQVLADFTFGGSTLFDRIGSPKTTVFIPTAGSEHVGLRGAKDQEEYETMKEAFASNWFRPTAVLQTMRDVPQDIIAFWSGALASALDQRASGSVPDDLLYTMYYFVWRYTDAYGLLDKLLCPRARAEFAQPLSKTPTGRALSSASATFRCIFEDYERRYKETLSATDSLLYSLNLK